MIEEFKKLKSNDFYLEKPSIKRKNEAKEYVKEFINKNEELKGLGKLKEVINNLTYENYLLYLDKIEKNEIEEVPETTYFLIRREDNKIVGITNLRHYLNERLKKCGGHIGYGIRPTERNKGYAKIGLYLTLLEAKKLNIKNVRVDCKKDNIQSNKVILKVGGKLYKTVRIDSKEVNLYI